MVATKIIMCFFQYNAKNIFLGPSNFTSLFLVTKHPYFTSLHWVVKYSQEMLKKTYLEAIPCFGTFSTRSLSGGDPQGLGWHSYWSLDLKIFLLGSLDQVIANLLQRLHSSWSQGDTDAMNGWFISNNSFLVFICRLNRRDDYEWVGLWFKLWHWMHPLYQFLK